jgi:hypothetical protein
LILFEHEEEIASGVNFVVTSKVILLVIASITAKASDEKLQLL